LAESYAQTDQGRAEAHRAREEGAYIYRQAKEIILRPGALGGIVGVFNLAVLGTVGYFAYENWDLPRWDRRTVSTVTAGLLGLSLGEGCVAIISVADFAYGSPVILAKNTKKSTPDESEITFPHWISS
jgi:hypothetical protein